MKKKEMLSVNNINKVKNKGNYLRLPYKKTVFYALLVSFIISSCGEKESSGEGNEVDLPKVGAVKKEIKKSHIDFDTSEEIVTWENSLQELVDSFEENKIKEEELKKFIALFDFSSVTPEKYYEVDNDYSNDVIDDDPEEGENISLENAQKIESASKDFEAGKMYFKLNDLESVRRCAKKLEKKYEWTAASYLHILTNDKKSFEKCAGILLEANMLTEIENAISFAIENNKFNVVESFVKDNNIVLSYYIKNLLARKGNKEYLKKDIEEKLESKERIDLSGIVLLKDLNLAEKAIEREYFLDLFFEEGEGIEFNESEFSLFYDFIATSPKVKSLFDAKFMTLADKEAHYNDDMLYLNGAFFIKLSPQAKEFFVKFYTKFKENNLDNREEEYVNENLWVLTGDQKYNKSLIKSIKNIGSNYSDGELYQELKVLKTYLDKSDISEEDLKKLQERFINNHEYDINKYKGLEGTIDLEEKLRIISGYFENGLKDKAKELAFSLVRSGKGKELYEYTLNNYKLREFLINEEFFVLSLHLAKENIKDGYLKNYLVDELYKNFIKTNNYRRESLKEIDNLCKKLLNAKKYNSKLKDVENITPSQEDFLLMLTDALIYMGKKDKSLYKEFFSRVTEGNDLRKPLIQTLYAKGVNVDELFVQ